ncbi:hypothetical protein [Nocardioides alcanivorans]|uniref:hypothetical protein n=1 Tax=Nocardioides alcanivorans TaxID=2897352 RepID=UPI001F3A8F16|nr:hypothetical protein [Nocardioides alcanivorans]
MAQKERPDEGPSLEMPSLGSLFKRGRKKPAPEPRADEPSAEDFERLVKGAPAEVADPVDDEIADTTPEAPEVDETEPVEQTQVRGIPVVADETVAEVEQTQVRGIAPVDESGAEDTAVLPEHDVIAEAEEADLADIEDDEPAAVPPPAAATPAPPAAAEPQQRRTNVDIKDDVTEESDDKVGRGLSDFALPALPAAVAAAVTGAIVGLLAVGLTYGGLEGCEAVKGTSACGGPGIPILGLIMVVLVIVGSVLLGAWKVTDPTSTSFLAVGLLAVIALLFLINVIFSPAMIVVIPLVSVATYSLSQWVTAHFIEED